MKVLIIGHACSPRQGSEPSFTWNWAWQLSRWHQVWVLTHPYNRDGIAAFLADHPRVNLKFEWVDVPRYIDPCAWYARDNSLRIHYLLWLPIACKKALELHEQIGFDLAHHVSYGTISAPPPFWKLPIPFIWGPIGGGQQTPSSFRRYFGGSWSWEVLRNAWVCLMRYSPSLRRAARASLVTLATNYETANLLKQIGTRDVRLCLDSGLRQNFVVEAGPCRSENDTLTLLWAGRMQPRKALPLALEALAEIDDVRVRLLVAGDGDMRHAWEDRARALLLERRVEFLGNVSWCEMPRLYQRADAFLFTSLRDSFGTQVLEAMGQGLPILTLDHHGVATFVPPEAGIKIPVTRPEETVAGIADGIRWLARHPEDRRRMGEAGRAFARTQTWEQRAEWMSSLYQHAVEAHAH